MQAVSILVVDDEPLIGELISRIMDKALVLVRWVTDARQALEVLEEAPADIVLADLVMPGEGGVDLLEEVRARWPQTLCALITGHPWPDAIIDAVNRGAIRKVLVKPIDRADAEAALAELVNECLAARGRPPTS